MAAGGDENERERIELLSKITSKAFSPIFHSHSLRLLWRHPNVMKFIFLLFFPDIERPDPILTPCVFLFFEMWIQFKMCLSFATKYLHFVLIKTFVRAELKLRSAIVEVDIADGIPDAFTKVTSFGTFERCTTPKKEATFRTENSSLRSNDFWWV